MSGHGSLRSGSDGLPSAGNEPLAAAVARRTDSTGTDAPDSDTSSSEGTLGNAIRCVHVEFSSAFFPQQQQQRQPPPPLPLPSSSLPLLGPISSASALYIPLTVEDGLRYLLATRRAPSGDTLPVALEQFRGCVVVHGGACNGSAYIATYRIWVPLDLDLAHDSARLVFPVSMAGPLSEPGPADVPPRVSQSFCVLQNPLRLAIYGGSSTVGSPIADEETGAVYVSSALSCFPADAAVEFKRMVPRSGSLAAPSARSFAAMTSISPSQLLVFGGFLLHCQLACNELWSFDLRDACWKQLTLDQTSVPSPRIGASLCGQFENGAASSSSLPSPPSLPSSAAKDCFVLAFGGWDGTKRHADLYMLELQPFRWTAIFPSCDGRSGAAPCARAGHSFVAIGKHQWLLSGGEGEGGQILSDSWRLTCDAARSAWAWFDCGLSGDLLPRSAHAMVDLQYAEGGGVLLFGGDSGEEDVLSPQLLCQSTKRPDIWMAVFKEYEAYMSREEEERSRKVRDADLALQAAEESHRILREQAAESTRQLLETREKLLVTQLERQVAQRKLEAACERAEAMRLQKEGERRWLQMLESRQANLEGRIAGTLGDAAGAGSGAASSPLTRPSLQS